MTCRSRSRRATPTRTAAAPTGTAVPTARPATARTSENGNGDGKATGKPCAGCVGKADNKNPPGQYKDGKDHNAGYECDRNHGIGRSNPAHTGCKSSTDSDCKPKEGEDDCNRAGCTPRVTNCNPGPGLHAEVG